MLKILGLLSVLFLPVLVSAQSQSSTTGGQASIWAGGEFSAVKDDFICGSFGCSHLLFGPAVFFDANLPRRLGVEGEARWAIWNGAGGESESNLLAGPRYRVFQHNQLDGWVKGVVGGGWITTPNYPQAGSLKGSFFAITPGITVDYRLKPRWALRGDYEYQFWPSFVGPPGTSSSGQPLLHNHGLTPNALSVGVSYRFLGLD